MNPVYYLNSKMLSVFLLQQLALQQELIATQQQLIEAQQENIALQRRIDKMTPKKPKDKDIFWHLVSDGISSTDAANSTDPITVRQFRDWNVNFAKKFIKPFVNDKVYGECLNQMTRGLAERMADLENKQWEASHPNKSKNSNEGNKTSLPSFRLNP